MILTGDVPSPANPPSGCRFHTRCWLYEKLGRPENCRTDDPALRVVGDDHRAACHYAEEALKSDVGVAHLDTSVRRTVVPGVVPDPGRPSVGASVAAGGVAQDGEPESHEQGGGAQPAGGG